MEALRDVICVVGAPLQTTRSRCTLFLVLHCRSVARVIRTVLPMAHIARPPGRAPAGRTLPCPGRVRCLPLSRAPSCLGMTPGMFQMPLARRLRYDVPIPALSWHALSNTNIWVLKTKCFSRGPPKPFGEQGSPHCLNRVRGTGPLCGVSLLVVRGEHRWAARSRRPLASRSNGTPLPFVLGCATRSRPLTWLWRLDGALTQRASCSVAFAVYSRRSAAPRSRSGRRRRHVVPYRSAGIWLKP